MNLELLLRQARENITTGYVSGQGHFNVAADLLTTVITESPKNGDALARRAEAYYGSGRYGASVGDAKRAIALGVTNPGIYRIAGQALHNLGRFEEAIQFLSVARD